MYLTRCQGRRTRNPTARCHRHRRLGRTQPGLDTRWDSTALVGRKDGHGTAENYRHYRPVGFDSSCRVRTAPLNAPICPGEGARMGIEFADSRRGAPRRYACVLDHQESATQHGLLPGKSARKPTNPDHDDGPANFNWRRLTAVGDRPRRRPVPPGGLPTPQRRALVRRPLPRARSEPARGLERRPPTSCSARGEDRMGRATTPEGVARDCPPPKDVRYLRRSPTEVHVPNPHESTTASSRSRHGEPSLWAPTTRTPGDRECPRPHWLQPWHTAMADPIREAPHASRAVQGAARERIPTSIRTLLALDRPRNSQNGDGPR